MILGIKIGSSKVIALLPRITVGSLLRNELRNSILCICFPTFYSGRNCKVANNGNIIKNG